MIIDAHCHAEENEAGWNHPPELLIDLMDKAGVDISYITTYGEYPYMENAGELLVSYCRKYPGRLYGFVRINPNGGEKGNEYLRRLVKKYPEEIRGVKLHPISNGLKPYHPNCLKLFHTCAELDIPLFTHCCDRVCAQPWQIAMAVRECPDTQFVCHIGGFFHGDEMIRVAQQYSNIMLDTSSVPYPELIRKAIETIGSDRVVYASDNPAGDPLVDIAKIEKLNLRKDIYEKIMYRNAAALIKLDLQEEKNDNRW